MAIAPCQAQPPTPHFNSNQLSILDPTKLKSSSGSCGLPWSEYHIFAELSLYELHRKPHEMVSDTTKIAISPRALHSELMCPICLDLMRNAQTTKEVGITRSSLRDLHEHKRLRLHIMCALCDVVLLINIQVTHTYIKITLFSMCSWYGSI